MRDRTPPARRALVLPLLLLLPLLPWACPAEDPTAQETSPVPAAGPGAPPAPPAAASQPRRPAPAINPDDLDPSNPRACVALQREGSCCDFECLAVPRGEVSERRRQRAREVCAQVRCRRWDKVCRFVGGACQEVPAR